MLKKAMKNEYIFKGLVGTGALIAMFGFWQFSIALKTFADKSQAENRIESAKITVMDARSQIDDIKKEFSNTPSSQPIDIHSNGHIVVQEIRKMAESYNLNIEATSKGSNRSSVLFTDSKLSTDSISGMLFFEGNMNISYNQYSDFKKFLNDVSSKYPISIDSLVIDKSQTLVGFKLYGV